ncbi:pyridoxamine 5'-phosphate oxidase family protein [Paludisphaera mucosa]|uniref:Pyridoxamine 5'-phosphate oxidase family protein n=1 Tax=Paludisphaera mucosa TaxID=3030827 RepID=A0ABT6F6N9_9BACT|nr:pyridoxamine 5'-phosphate oxidase family protein [Paludisphaera mucosa]MDG3003219.1 pyridoxamine 5'-phosphate oxidase family protein [Paludisphaera mucosa]
MDSINQNQPEQNHEDLHGPKAVAEIQTIVRKAENGFFCTVPMAGSRGTRPMNVRQVDDQGHLWFLAANDSHQVQELQRDPSVKLYFHGSQHSDFLYLEGRATLSAHKAKIAELWEPVLKTWFTGGQDDPRITVIEVAPTEGYYWDTKHGGMVAGIKMLVGAAIGVTLDDSIEGTLDV